MNGYIARVALACLILASSFARAEPSSDIYLDPGATLEFTEFLLGGAATDPGGIAAVTLAVQNRSTGLWLQPDGSWKSGAARLSTNLSTPGAQTTRWLFRKSLPIGQYLANAAATNTAGATQSTGSRINRQFAIVADRPALDSGSPWLTIHFGRSIWGVAGGGDCAPYADPVDGTVFLDEVAAFLFDHGYAGQGSVPFGQFDPDPSIRKCPWRGVMSASLNDLAMLRDVYGWTFVADSIGPLPSNPSDRPNIASLACSDQITTTAASLAELMRLGHHRAWGLFADPGNSVTDAIRDDISAHLYTFTRKYGSGVTQNEITSAKAEAGDWARFKSVNGGLCNDPAAACYDHVITAGDDGHYELPSNLFPFMVATPGNWRGIQFYRFVRGVHLPDGYPGTAAAPAGSSRESYWDCTAADPSRHWTSRAEIYCYDDFVDLFERLSSEYPNAIATDAAHVASSWGIGNANHRTSFPSCGVNSAPVARFAYVCNALTCSFDASSTSDADTPNSALTFGWTFGDGQTAQLTGVATVSHKYAKPGKTNVTLEVTDGGGLSATARASVKPKKSGQVSGTGR
jgi:hypothetical protein